MAITRMNTLKLIEKNIHFTWLGSQLIDEEIERILTWKEINPQYQIYLWTLPTWQNEIKKQFQNKPILIEDLNQLKLSQKLSNFLHQIMEIKKDATRENYGAAKDAYEGHILWNFGGWHVDVDILPREIDNIPINPCLGLYFKFGCLPWNPDFGFYSPSVLAATKKNVFIEKYLAYFETLADFPSLIDHIRVNNSERYYNTILTTGAALQAVLQNIYYNDQALATINNTINMLNIHPALAREDFSVRENDHRSWYKLPEITPTLSMQNNNQEEISKVFQTCNKQLTTTKITDFQFKETNSTYIYVIPTSLPNKFILSKSLPSYEEAQRQAKKTKNALNLSAPFSIRTNNLKLEGFVNAGHMVIHKAILDELIKINNHLEKNFSETEEEKTRSTSIYSIFGNPTFFLSNQQLQTLQTQIIDQIAESAECRMQ